MNVLVTGGSGFIGSHTVDLLIDEGHNVRILDNLEPQVHQNKKPDYLNSEAEYVWGDITEKENLLEALENVEVILHLAAMVGVGQSMYQPIRYLTTNAIGTANLYEVLIEKPEIKKNIKKIVVASSKSIYGEGAYNCKEHETVYPKLRSKEQLVEKDWEVRCPFCKEYVKPVGITEEKPVQNLSLYALSKYDTERIAVDFGTALGISTVAFRYFNVYGPRQSLNNPYTGVAAIFSSRIKNNNPPIIFEDGDQIRDFIFVEDIARVNVLGLESNAEGVYNVGAEKPISILEIAKTLIDVFDSNIEPKITNEFRDGDNRHDFADSSKVKKELGFKPKCGPKGGFEKLVEWGQKEEAIDMFEKSEEERKRFLGN